MQHILQFIHVAEQLKKEMRHSWLSNGRQESVAEHTWRLTVMAMALEPYLKQPLRMEKLLKMLIIHDLVEVYAGDIPAFEQSKRKEQKHVNEQRAIECLQQLLGGVAGQELYDLWQEFEARETYEAKVANAIDKLEVQIQHNEASLDTWLPIEHEMTFNIAKHTEFDDALEQLRLLVVDEAAAKLEAGNIDISKWIKKV